MNLALWGRWIFLVIMIRGRKINSGSIFRFNETLEIKRKRRGVISRIIGVVRKFRSKRA
jgi:hypothetical protein